LSIDNFFAGLRPEAPKNVFDFCKAAPSRLFRIGRQLPEPTRRKRSGRCYSPSGAAISGSDVIGCFSPAPRQSGDLYFDAIARRKSPADFSRSPLEILGGPQSRVPHPVGSGALGVDPMPGGNLFQSFDCFQRVFGHQCDLLNSPIWFGVTLRQTVAISATRRTLLPCVIEEGNAIGAASHLDPRRRKF
jgi:hypothetical protein